MGNILIICIKTLLIKQFEIYFNKTIDKMNIVQ
jgi:hypothetical protein